MITIKRVYELENKRDGKRFLVERLWPRGMRKAELVMDGWLKEAAPSTELREWFHHEPDKWDDFQARYQKELEDHPEHWAPILEASRQGNVTLLYSAHDTDHNNALVLMHFVQHFKQTLEISR
jgi:uncharacterized protein YeaO (DUF488 family)